VYSLESLMPFREFAMTPIFNEWWKPADYSLGMLGVNLLAEEQMSSVLCVVSAPGHDSPSNEQTRLFEEASRHITRAVRIHRQLWTLDQKHLTALERFEGLCQGAILVDADANVLFINPAARERLDAGDGIVLKGGCLATTDGADTLQRLIASCARAVGPMRGTLGGSFEVRRGPHRAALGLAVTPLRSKNPAAEISWLGLRTPVALITIADPDISRRRLAQELHERFGLTAAEAGLAAEIAKGDGRQAAARRRGISVTTARSQLSSIFEKTGTHRQAELVHFLLQLSDKSNLEKRDI
jgi:DNA-binding CsgD family transcriptional regulator